MENGESLIGPRADERGERTIEDVDANGLPLWMAFLTDPDSPTLSKEEVQDAKNALQAFQTKDPETISLCKHKTVDECRHLVHPAEAA